MILSFADWLIIIGYFIFLIIIGFYKKNESHSQNQKEFILSSRTLSLPGFIATLVTTWYGSILGVGENTYLYGIQTWFIFGVPYYVFALLYAFWLTNKIDKFKVLTIPDIFRKSFGAQAGILSGFLLFILSSPAPYILSLSVLLKYIFNINLITGLIISTSFSIAYVWNGGFRAVIRTDYFQFILMFLGFLLLFIYSWIYSISPIMLLKTIPIEYIKPLGGNTLEYVLVWFFIALWTLVDPGFFQRCAAVSSPGIAKKGLLIAIIFWFVFDFLTIFSGLYAVHLISTEDALLAYPLLAIKVLPPIALGLFFTSIFAVMMSTIDSLSLINATTFGRDILWRFKKDKNQDPTRLIKSGLIIMGLVSIVLAISIPSVIRLLYTIGSLIIPGLIIPFIFSLNNNKIVSEHLALYWIITPIIISLLWFLCAPSNIILSNIEPFYPGILVSIILYIFIMISTEKT